MTTYDSTQPNLPTDSYWAAVPTDQLADVIRAKCDQYLARLNEGGRVALMRKAERTYYGHDGEGGWNNSVAVTYGGEDGEITMLRVNHFRSIVQGLLAMTSKSRPAFDVMSLNNDAKSLSIAKLLNGILDGYYRLHGLEQVHVESNRAATIVGEGYTVLRWATWLGPKAAKKTRPVYDDGGQPVVDVEEVPVIDESTGAETGEVQTQETPRTEQVTMYGGDIEVASFHPIEIVRDLDAQNERDLKWALVPYRENVWDLAGRYPEKRAELLSMRGSAELWPRSAWDGDGTTWQRPEPNSDVVTTWYLYHPVTDALPNGRHSIVTGRLVLHDGVMELPEVPVYACMPEREMATASGHSPQFDLLALQEVVDSIWSTMTTNQDAFGLQNILVPEDADMKEEMLARGLRVLKFKTGPDGKGGKPEVMQMLAIPKDSYQLLELAKQTMEVLSGVNSVVRGDPPAEVKSGAALALVQSLAVAFNSQMQRAFTLHHERVATGVVKMLQRYADTPRVASVIGRTRKGALQRWSAESLRGIERVTVQIGNPVTDTTAGKQALADSYLAKGVITSPQEYEEVAQTGRLQPALESDDAAITNIREENELLAEGKPVQIALTDDHALHVREHRAVLDSQVVRTTQPEVVQLVNAHIAEHMQQWETMPPQLAVLTKQSVMPPPPPPPMPMGPPGAPPGGAPHEPPPKPSGPPDDSRAKTTVTERARPLGGAPAPDLPLMPTNPLTGERATP